MQESSEVLKTALRVLTALTEKCQPGPLDVDTLRRYSGPSPEGLGLVEWVITNGESHNCNCVETTEVSAKSFLGTPYVNVRGHSRHIQESLALSRYQH